MLHGVCLSGRENSDYKVTLSVKNTSNNSTAVSETGTFSSKLLPYKSSNYYGFEVLFDPVVNLNKGTKYQIEALISGPPSLWGIGGSSIIWSSGVKFVFSNSLETRSNGTSCTGGQFVELLFSFPNNEL